MGGHHLSLTQFVTRLIVGLAVIGLALLLWQLRSVLVLVFGAVVVAVIIDAFARPLRSRLHFTPAFAMLASLFIVTALVVGALWLFGARVATQIGALREIIPEAWSAVQSQLDVWGIGDAVSTSIEDFSSGASVLTGVSGLALAFGGALTNTILMVVGGIYLAVRPQLYIAGLLKLLPKRARGRMAQALRESGGALRLWLLGQAISMLIIGTLTFIGLTILGVPGALALGVIAGLLEFVPYVGPILAAVPAILTALAVSPELALWTALLYLAIQQAEGNLVQPLVQQKAVHLPPALLLFSLVANAILFGWIGILLAAPLTVVGFILIKRLYVRGALQTPTGIPGTAPSD
jgi:predicted PurR-regulated permease PerM